MKNISLLEKFEKLFRQYQPALVSYAYNYLKSREDALEVVQDVFVSIWNKRGELALDQSLKGYLFTATRNKSLNFLQKKKISTVSFNAAVHDGQVEKPSHERMEAQELETALYDEIYQLPAKCRQIFLLSRQDGMTYAEIANQLNISVKTVENQISIALKRLRKRLADYNNTGKMVFVLIILLSLFGGTILENGILY